MEAHVVNAGCIALLLLGSALAPCALRAQVPQIQGVPFTATQVITWTSPTGTRRTEGQVARDRAGSTYVEEVDPATGSLLKVMIFDVPGKRLITLNVPRRRYSVQAIPQLSARSVPMGWVGDQLRWAAEHRDRSEREVKGSVRSTQRWLGTRQVNGLLTIGTVKERRPTDARAGAGTEVDESWFSVELGLPVLLTQSKPAAGLTTQVTLTGVLRAEPKPALFAIPAGYAPESRVQQPAAAGAPSEGL